MESGFAVAAAFGAGGASPEHDLQRTVAAALAKGDERAALTAALDAIAAARSS
jgi:hypothetical protein